MDWGKSARLAAAFLMNAPNNDKRAVIEQPDSLPELGQ